jgi:hypothetical protein
MNRFCILLTFMLSLGGPAAFGQELNAHPGHAPAHDGRTVPEPGPGERAMILQEIRLFLDGVQKLTGALGHQDMPAAAEAARAMGQKMVHEVPPALRAKLPLEFRQQGFSVNRDFDQMALDADNLKDVGHSLNPLSATHAEMRSLPRDLPDPDASIRRSLLSGHLHGGKVPSRRGSIRRTS